jgi:hypothetical protein
MPAIQHEQYTTAIQHGQYTTALQHDQYTKEESGGTGANEQLISVLH